MHVNTPLPPTKYDDLISIVPLTPSTRTPTPRDYQREEFVQKHQQEDHKDL